MHVGVLLQVNVSRLSKILIPVHTGNHWSLAHISIKELVSCDLIMNPVLSLYS